MPLDSAQWSALLSAQTKPFPRISADSFRRVIPTASRPVLFICSDGADYLVKGPDLNRTPITEQIVAYFGHLLDAPIPLVTLVDVPAELHKQEPQIQHLTPGPAHGSRWQDNCSERMDKQNVFLKENRSRFAALAVLYTWMHATDHQVIYSRQAPELVFSVDHGHFFGGGQAWSPAILAAIPSISRLDPWFDAVNLTAAELVPVYDELAQITVAQIATGVARPCRVWGVTIAEQIAMCTYLDRRQHEILALRPMP